MVIKRCEISGLLRRLGNQRYRTAVVLTIAAIALLLRIATVLILPLDYRLRDDALEYVAVAENTLDYGVYGEEPGVPYAVVPPLYPLFMACVLSFTGRSLLAVRLVQSLLGAASVWFIYLAGRRTFSTMVGLGAALIYAVYPPFVVYSATYMTEALYIPLFAFYSVFFVSSLKEPSVKHIALAGLGFGLSMLTKETLIAFPLVLPIVFWWTNFDLRQALRYGSVFAIVALLVIAPWLVRNYSSFGHAFYTSRTAYIQYKLTGTGYLSPRFVEQAEKTSLPVTEANDKYDYYQHYGRSSDLWDVSLVLSDPGRYVRYSFNRLIEFWFHPNGLSSLPEEFIVRVGYLVVHIAMLGIAFWQFMVNLWKRDGVTGGLVILLLYITVVGTFFTRPIPRYNLPFLPIVMTFTARGALELVKKCISQWETAGGTQPAE